MDDLSPSSPERQLLSQRRIVAVVLTASALVSTSQRGRLLREALVARGVSHVSFDEIDTVHSSGMAAYSPELAQSGALLQSMASQMLERKSISVPPLVCGYTATLPVSYEEEVLKRLGISGAVVLRYELDRPELSYLHVPFFGCKSDTMVEFALRAFMHVYWSVPSWARSGRVVVFGTLTSTLIDLARKLTAIAQRTGHCPPAWPYTSNNMSDEERSDSLASFRAHPRGVLCASPAFAQGVSEVGVYLAVHLQLADGVVQHAQQNGRCARESSESGLCVPVLNGRFARERLRLCLLPAREQNRSRVAVRRPSPAHVQGADRTAGPLMLLHELNAPGCTRARTLHYLGGSVDGRCRGCCDCVRSSRGAPEALKACGHLPFASHWCDATGAAALVVRLAQGRSQQGDPLLFSELACAEGWLHSRSVWAEPPRWDRLVDRLLGLALLVNTEKTKHGRLYLTLSVATCFAQRLKCGAETVMVLVEGSADNCAVCSALNASNSRQRAVQRGQRLRFLLEEGLRALQAAVHLIEEQMDEDGHELLSGGALELTDPQMRLLESISEKVKRTDSETQTDNTPRKTVEVQTDVEVSRPGPAPSSCGSSTSPQRDSQSGVSGESPGHDPGATSAPRRTPQSRPVPATRPSPPSLPSPSACASSPNRRIHHQQPHAKRHGISDARGRAAAENKTSADSGSVPPAMPQPPTATPRPDTGNVRARAHRRLYSET